MLSHFLQQKEENGPTAQAGVSSSQVYVNGMESNAMMLTNRLS